MFKNIFLLNTNKEKYNTFIKSFKSEFSETKTYFDINLLVNDLYNMLNEKQTKDNVACATSEIGKFGPLRARRTFLFQNSEVFSIIIEYTYLESIYSFIKENFNSENLILVTYSEDIPSDISNYKLFDHVQVNGHLKLFFNKLKNEIINKKKLLFLQFEVSKFYEIGKILSVEKDTLKLLDLIIESSIELTNCDAGTIYLVVDKNTKKLCSLKDKDYANKELKFAIAKNKSINISFESSTSPITKESIFGFSVITGKSLIIDDAYNINPNLSYKHNKNYDIKSGYITKSILTIPMKDNDGDVIGVIQLINKKKNTNEKIIYNVKSSVENIIPFDHTDEMIMNSLVSQASIILTNNLLYNEMNDQNKHLSFLSKKLLKAHEDERRRIAREIHDGPAQSCANLSIRLQIIKKLFENNRISKINDELNVLDRSIKETLNDIRGIIYDLKPSYLEDGLISSIKSHLDVFKDLTKININFSFKGDDSKIEYYLTSTIFRIIQESLSNIKKHANAKNVSIVIDIKENYILINISDDGVGFKIDKLKNNKTLNGGFGIEGIKERVHIVKGNFQIKSEIGIGTEISIKIPYI